MVWRKKKMLSICMPNWRRGEMHILGCRWWKRESRITFPKEFHSSQACIEGSSLLDVIYVSRRLLNFFSTVSPNILLWTINHFRWNLDRILYNSCNFVRILDKLFIPKQTSLLQRSCLPHRTRCITILLLSDNHGGLYLPKIVVAETLLTTFNLLLLYRHIYLLNYEQVQIAWSQMLEKC